MTTKNVPLPLFLSSILGSTGCFLLIINDMIVNGKYALNWMPERTYEQLGVSKDLAVSVMGKYFQETPGLSFASQSMHDLYIGDNHLAFIAGSLCILLAVVFLLVTIFKGK